MPLPLGFVEVHAIQSPPFLAYGDLRTGAVVKYLRTREAVSSDDTEDEQLRQFISETGTGVMVHEFQTRGGQGLVFKLRGAPSLDAKLCAVRTNWIAWLQFLPSKEWAVAIASDLRQLRELLIKNRAVDDDLDREICERAGAFHRRRPELEDVRAPRAPYSRDVDDVEFSTPYAAVARVRALLAHGVCMLSDVRRAVLEDGHTLEQFQRALQEVGARLGRPRQLAGKKCATVYLPSSDAEPVRLTRVGIALIRAAIERDLAEWGETAEIARSGMENGLSRSYEPRRATIADAQVIDPWHSDERSRMAPDRDLDEDEATYLEELFRRHGGRAETRSPVEGARAWNAPLLHTSDARRSARESGPLAGFPDVKKSRRPDVEGDAELSSEQNAKLDELLSRPFPVLLATKRPRQLSPDAPACAKLRELLANGAQPAVDVEREMIAAGFRGSRIKEARKVLGAISRRGRTCWEIWLPESAPDVAAGD